MDETKSPPETQDMNDSADSDPAVSRFYGNARKLMEHYNHCQLCGSNLHFTHVTDFNRNITMETARCPECGVKARQVQHKLQ